MSSPNSEKWQEAKEIFYAALQRAPKEREQFVNESCKDDDDLRREVESLLSSSEAAGSFMQNPAMNEIAEALAANKEKLRVNESLNHYKILNLLGQGGMGEVYLAEDIRLERKVALKILPAAFAQDKGRMRRFVQEAKAASALNHPNILTIYETGEFENTKYIVSEYVEGETLSERLRREPLNLKAALDVAVQITSALQAAHNARIVHRDIKPDNVMIRPDGFVKVLDFGIAKLTEKQSEVNLDSEAATAIKANTTPGMIIGTANYMSPEQAKGNIVDARTDIFSFGLVLYEMLAGKRAFEGENAIEVISSILQTEPVPLSRLMPDVPHDIERIVGKALRKDCEERYQTAKDLLIDLKDARQELEFQKKFERSSAPPQEQLDTQIINAATTDAAQTSSSAEQLIAEIKNHKLGFVLSVLVLTGVGLSYWYFSHRISNTKQIESIAIMPFVNQSGNADTEYLSDGMTETLISSLSQLPKLNVKARSSVFRYKGANTDLQQIAKELNVQAILNGRIVKRGGDLSLYVELVDVALDKVIWSQTYNRQMSNLVSLQSEVARDVSNNLRTKLSGADEQKLAKNYTANAEAYQLYLKGMYEWKKHTLEDLQKGIEYFNQAIELDPNYALAYQGLSGSYGVLGNAYLPPNENFPKAKAYAAKALAIDDTLSEAHTAMGADRLLYDWDWAETEKEFKRAQILNPNYADAHQLYAAYLEAMGRFDEALVEANRAQELDPLSAMFSMEVGTTLYYARQYPEAIAQLEKTINLEPRYVEAYFYLGQAYEQKKMYAQAIATIQKGMTQAERHPQLIAALGHAYALSGERDKAQQALAELREMSKRRYVSPYLIAVVYVGLGDKEQAFAWLDKAVQDRSFFLIWLKVEQLFDPLRADPRFQDLLRRVGLMG
jgi:serine/threonine protein kinase/Flp pilus assembly protein TadD